MEKNITKYNILRGLEDLITEALNTPKVEEIIKDLPSEYNDLGELTNDSLMKNIKKSQIFSPPSAIYGNRYGKNILYRWELRDKNNDIFIADQNGILKNNFNDLGTYERITDAKKNNIPVFFFFGGSTMMSVGSITPNFSIPSLVERIFKIKFKKKILCVNFGHGGTCITEASNLYLHESRKYLKSANVVFYDGWNCSSYLTLMNRIKECNLENSNIKVNIFNGDSIRQLEHNYVLSKIYSLRWNVSRVKNLILVYFFDYIYKCTPSKILKKIIKGLQNRLTDIRPNEDLQKVYSKLSNDFDAINSASKLAVDEYIDLHKSVNSICNSSGGNFYWFQQPIIFWSNKPLTHKEAEWKNRGFASGDPRIFKTFEENFNLIFKKKYQYNKELKFKDLTGIFNNIEEEVFIDSGHLNRLGNLIVAAEIASEINNDKNLDRN